MKNYFKILLILVIPLIWVVVYGWSEWQIPSEDAALVKVEMESVKEFLCPSIAERKAFVRDSLITDSIAREEERKRHEPDTSHQTILFFGDSMVEGLSRRLCDYALENGHDYTSVCWYSSTSEIYAKTDTLQYFMKKVKPTYAIISLGGNEQFVNDLPKREKYLNTIISRLNGIPYIFIAPPSWKKDTGINALILKVAGKSRFFDSTKLTFERGKDHVHPTFKSAEMWMDSIAAFMSGKDVDHPILMKVPSKKRPREWKQYLLQPIEQ